MTGGTPVTASSQSFASIAPVRAEAESVARFPRSAMAGGVLNAVVVSWLLAWWHDSFRLQSAVLFFIALFYVALATLAAAAGARYYWRRAKFRSRFTLPELVWTWAAAWVWAPAVVLLLRRDLYWTPLLAALAAALPACAMRWMRVQSNRMFPAEEPTAGQPIFAATLQPIPSDWHGAVIAACIYLGCAAFSDNDTLIACAAAAIGAFLFAGQRAAALDGRAEAMSTPRRTQRRLIWSAALAVLATMLALVPGKHGDGAEVSAAVKAANAAAKKAGENGGGGLSNYRSVILWPLKPKDQLIVPASLLHAAPLTRQQTIRFSGAYWYFQAPQTEPGPHAHTAHGDPLKVDIHTVNYRPLMMQAHQSLAKPIRLSTVREIDVALLNSDNRRGLLSIGLLLTDSDLPQGRALNLGIKPLPSSEPEHFQVKIAPVEETLRFAIPAQARARRFDGITVQILPDATRMNRGAKVAIDSFDLVPH